MLFRGLGYACEPESKLPTGACIRDDTRSLDYGSVMSKDLSSGLGLTRSRPRIAISRCLLVLTRDYGNTIPIEPLHNPCIIPV